MRSTTTRVAGVYAAVLVITVSTAAAAVGIPAIAIDNFGQVDAGYFRGAQPQGDDYAALARLGVRAVLNLTSDDADPSEEVSVARNGMVYLHLPMNTRVEPTVEQLRTFLALVNAPSHQPVYVHCVGGRHRTGVMTAVYRMTHDGWTADQAFKEMKQYKYGADFLHPEFKRFVLNYRPDTPGVFATQVVGSN